MSEKSGVPGLDNFEQNFKGPPKTSGINIVGRELPQDAMTGSQEFRMANPPGKGNSIESQLRDQIERQMAAFDRAAEGGEERMRATTLPWEARMATRDVITAFVDSPVGLGDSWGYQRFFAGLGERAKSLRKLVGSESTKKAIGLNLEPWRDVSLISRNNQNELRLALLESGIPANKIEGEIKKYLSEAKARAPALADELMRSQDEVVRVRKVFLLRWNMSYAASGNEVGDIYLQNKIPTLPRPYDFALMLSAPSYYMSHSEAGQLPGYPEESDVKSFLKEENRSEENLPLGETTEKETRLLYLAALSERPELVMRWKHKTEQEALFNLYKAAGVNEAYLILKEKGIDYRDPVQEALIGKVLDPLSGSQEQKLVRDVWWQKLGFKDESDGISQIGDPEKWIPMKARRGKAVGDKDVIGLDRDALKTKIDAELEVLKELWQELSPIANKTETEKERIRVKIEKCTDSLRFLQTHPDDKSGKLITIFPTLQLEREMGLRKGAAEMGCIWSVPKTAGEKEKMMEKVFADYTKGDHLAFEQAKALAEMWGFMAKHGVYAVNYDPRQQENDGWGEKNVGVEGWPYTNEFQNILAFPWWARYKGEAGGPEGSRGKFGPLMTDYLTACVTQKYDEFGNPLYVIIDSQKQIRIGRVDEGLILADTTQTLMDVWEKGISLSDTKLWKDIDEDPFRRWLLRPFFAEGKVSIGGSGMVDIWKQREWKPDDLDNDKFWDAYKLNRKVTVRDELFDEEVWVDVLKTHNKNYQKKAGEVVQQVVNSNNPTDVIKNEAEMFFHWKDGRWKVICDYSDQMFWRGVATQKFVLNLSKAEVGMLEKAKQEEPHTYMKRIIDRAKKCSINLVGEFNKDIDPIMKGVKASTF